MQPKMQPERNNVVAEYMPAGQDGFVSSGDEQETETQPDSGEVVEMIVVDPNAVVSSNIIQSIIGRI